MTWLNLAQLSTLPQFTDITNQITRSPGTWKTWFDDAEPEEITLPDGYDSVLDTFRKLLLIRSWCPDRTLAQARDPHLDLLRAPYVLYGVKYIDLVSLAPVSGTQVHCFKHRQQVHRSRANRPQGRVGGKYVQ